MFDDPQAALADEAPPTAAEVPPAQDGARRDPAPTEQDLALQRRITRTIREDKRHFKKAFEQMRRDMRIAMKGHDNDWSDDKYKANITGRHVKAKTASLYAKNPKAVARRADKMDFKIWNEDQQSLLMAFQTMQAAQAAAALSQQQAAGEPSAMVGHNGGPPIEPQLPPGFAEAQALIADFQQGMAARMQAQRIAKTLEKLFAHAIREQQPLGFKESMKQTVRRACTTGVGYVKLCYQRQMGPSPSVEYRLNDSRVRLEHLKNLIERQRFEDGDVTDLEAEAAEIEHLVEALSAEPEVVASEGLVFDFPQSTRVIPDRLCRSLEGFVGARHLTLEYLYTPDEVKEIFGVELGRKFKPYNANGKLADDTSEAYQHQSDLLDAETPAGEQQKGDLCLVWEYFDKAAGLVYYICDGYEGWLKPPGNPDVFVDQFWPVWALTFNAVESEDELFPPSDVALLRDIQKEYNRSRDGKREHRRAARPRWVFSKGAFTDEDLGWLGTAPAFTATGLNIDPTKDIKTQLQAVPVPGVDPNLYDVGEIMTDLQYVVGNSTAGLGTPQKGTATANSIAAGANATADQSSIDDLDNFLTAVVRGAGQILMREMSEQTVVKVVGPGALWPEQTLQEIADELSLEIEAGSTGKPNQAVEIANWEKMLPFIMQMQGISPQWLARETLRRLDDRMDLTEALVDSLPSIVAQNRQAASAPGDPNAQPEAQGHNGIANGPAAPGGPAGRGAPMGAQRKRPLS
ncbi:hypothetical protein [Methylobacterium brachiatum]|uniref:hypothetical protein n=1 Tax=Methylobacterium brachiatum TaxID=269660 RepID=UPI0008E81B22|nr:hypothetical protein [Methylobacterium brachiatum]SFI05630.1 hypothetical protein SAMN02799642_00570 [Methylobacterium brachiatum]